MVIGVIKEGNRNGVNDRINGVGCRLVVTPNFPRAADFALLLLCYCKNARSLQVRPDVTEVALLLQTLHDVIEDCSFVTDEKIQQQSQLLHIGN